MKRYAELIRKKSIRSIDKKLYDNTLKTAIIKEIAEERGAKFVRVELSSMEEIGDLLGIPVKEFNMISPTGEEQWVMEKLIEEYISLGWKLCPNCIPRMGYAIPSWVPRNPDEEVLLLLDDYTR